MDKLILDPATIAKLGQLDHGVELCDESGTIFGWYQPTFVPGSRNAGYEPPFSEAELRAADEESGGRTLAEIMADWSRLP